jgi:tetrahydromethanopterin S-methyltransferase subunit H
MENKPVAWQWLDTANFRKKLPKHANKCEWKPLYTALRDLSDKEVMELAEYHGINDWLYETSVTDFARAILKKASEA